VSFWTNAMCRICSCLGRRRLCDSRNSREHADGERSSPTGAFCLGSRSSVHQDRQDVLCRYGWPFGVALIGLQIAVMGDGEVVRRLCVAGVYLSWPENGIGALTMARSTGVIFKN